jgi:hypothetical protein
VLIEATGAGFTVILTVEEDGAHDPFEMVQLSIYVPAPPSGVKVAVGFVVLLSWLMFVLGPLTIAHTPVPTAGVFAANVVLGVVRQSV